MPVKPHFKIGMEGGKFMKQTKTQTKLQNKNTANNCFGKAAAKKTAALVCTALVLGLLPNGGVIAPSEVYAQGGTATPSEPEEESPELEPSEPETEIPETEKENEETKPTEPEIPDTQEPEEGASEGETEKPEEESKADLPETEATPSVPEEPEVKPDTADLLEVPDYALLTSREDVRSNEYFTFAARAIMVRRIDKPGKMLESPFIVEMKNDGSGRAIAATLLNARNFSPYAYKYSCELDMPGFHLTLYDGDLPKMGSQSSITLEASDLSIAPGTYEGALTIKFKQRTGSISSEGIFEETFPIEVRMGWTESYRSNLDGTHIRISPNGESEPLDCAYIDDGRCLYCRYQRIMITKQPEDVRVKLGGSANFEVADKHDPAITPTYQWQFSEWGDSWTDIEGANESAYTIPVVSEEMDATYYRCEIKNGKDTAVSEIAELTIGSDLPPEENNGGDCFSNFDGTHFYDDGTGTGTPEDCIYDAEGVCTLCGYHRLIITEEPQDVTAKLGAETSFSVKAKGDGANKALYQWQFSSDGGTTWHDDLSPSGKEPVYKIDLVVEVMRNNLQRCKITNGKDIVYSRAALLTIEDESKPVPPEEKPEENDRPSNSSGGSGSSGSSRSNVTVTIYERPNGKWSQDADGAWSFAKPDGTQVKNEWYECVWNGVKSWYFFGADGKSQKGWLAAGDGNTYFLHDKNDGGFGAMYTGWHWIDGKCYYFNTVSGQNGLPYGALLKSGTTPDGYTVNAEGQWVMDGSVVTQ